MEWSHWLLWNKLQKQVYRPIGTACAAFPEYFSEFLLNHHQIPVYFIVFLFVFYGYCLRYCSSEWTQLASLLYSRWRFTHYADRLHNNFVIIPRYYKHVYVCSMALCTVKLCNSLPAECFPLTYYRNQFISRFSMHLLSLKLLVQLSSSYGVFLIERIIIIRHSKNLLKQHHQRLWVQQLK